MGRGIGSSAVVRRTRWFAAAAVVLLVGGAAARAAPVTLDDVEYWVGSGSNRAGVVIDWNDGKTAASLVWGFRWDGAADGTDALAAVVAADPRLFAHVSTPHPTFGVSVYGLGHDADGDGFGVNPPLAFDAGGTAVSGSPPADDNRAPTDPADHYRDGWTTGYWSYWTGSGATPAWTSSQVGAGDRLLVDGGWDGWSFAPGFDGTAPSDPTPAAVPEPAAAGVIAVAAMVGLGRRRRGVLADRHSCLSLGSQGNSRTAGPFVDLSGRVPGTRSRVEVPSDGQECLPHQRGGGGRVRARYAAAGLAFALLPAAAARGDYVYDADDFAVEVVGAAGPFGAAPYDAAASVLGRPTLRYDSSFNPNVSDVRRAKLVEGVFNTGPAGEKLVTTLPVGSRITVRMGRPVTDDPRNPFGVDFLVFGNAFYAGTGADAAETSDLTAYRVTGLFAERTKVSVSPDGVIWYRYEDGPYADAAFPTNSYLWDRAAKAWTDVESDPTRPVDPAAAGLAAGRSAADVLDLYAGSAGGTGFDLAASGFASIQFIRVEGLTDFAGGEIDAFADVRPVPEPAGAGLLAAAAAALGKRRRARPAVRA